MKKINFRDWTVEKVEDAFGLKQVFKTDLLDTLLSFQYEIADYERKTLLRLQNNYLRRGMWISEFYNMYVVTPKF